MRDDGFLFFFFLLLSFLSHSRSGRSSTPHDSIRLTDSLRNVGGKAIGKNQIWENNERKRANQFVLMFFWIQYFWVYRLRCVINDGLGWKHTHLLFILFYFFPFSILYKGSQERGAHRYSRVHTGRLGIRLFDVWPNGSLASTKNKDKSKQRHGERGGYLYTRRD